MVVQMGTVSGGDGGVREREGEDTTRHGRGRWTHGGVNTRTAGHATRVDDKDEVQYEVVTEGAKT